MPTAYSARQIAQVAQRAGWRGEDLVIAVAVALAESSGRYWIVNPIGCVGLWQINVPTHGKAHPTWTTANMKDPDRNAAAAMVLWRDRKWQPWEAYTGPDGKGADGPFTLQMGRARIAVAQLGAAPSAAPASATTGGGGATSGQFAALVSGQQAGFTPFDNLISQWLGQWLAEETVEEFSGQEIPDNRPDLSVPGMLDISGPLGTMARSIAAMSVLPIRAAAWMSEPRNWLRVVEVVGGAVALFIGLKMLANSNTGGPVAGAVRGGVKAAEKTVSAAKKVGKTAAAATPAGRAATVAASTAKG